jgi:ribA/ribD-fused uncharacterized protein
MITRFDGPYRFLSNFCEAPVRFRLSCMDTEVTAPTNEHAFQADKALHHQEALAVLRAATPGEAKRLGRKVTLRPDWESKRKTVMFTLLLLKFAQHPDLSGLLEQTGGELLVEGNNWHDNYWGMCVCQRCSAGALTPQQHPGRNHLGRLLMGTRYLRRAD